MNIKLSPEERIKILNSTQLYGIMRKILLREEEIDQDREHAWIIGLAQNNRILFIELISMGSISATITEPMDVFSFALQKRAVSIILVHNHPSGELKPSAADLDMTDQMIQVGIIVKTRVLDHLIITLDGYLSFEDEGLMAELAKSTKYVPPYVLRKRLENRQKEILEQQKEMRKQNKELNKLRSSTTKTVIALHDKGASIDEIKEITGLTKKLIREILKGDQ